LQVAFNDEKLAAIGDPGLMPDFSRSIENAEALSFVAVEALIVFVNDAPIENAVDANVGFFCGSAEVEGVPIAEPKVEFVILGNGTRRGCN